MNGIRTVVLVGCLTLALVVVIQGCKKEEPVAQPTSQSQTEQLAAAADEVATAASEQAAEVIEQKTCPIMGQPINKAVFVEHEGKKVYFCCKGCEDKFKANPELYVKDLPQFQN